MCHVSVGHIARLLEEAGVPTVIVAIKAFRQRIEVMKPPRLLLTPHALGRPLGKPHDVARQKAVLVAALKLLQEAEQGNTIVAFREIGD